MDSYRHYLRAFFGKSSLPTETKWQPSITKSYINLAVISREKVTHKEQLKFMIATLHGDVDGILKVKEPVKIEHILDHKPGEVLQCVLAEGAPGVGKTTLAWQVCHRWGKGELFQQYTLVVLVKLREEVVRKAKTLANLLISQEDERTTVEIAEYLKQTNGKNVLVILEGLDELPISLLTQRSIFTKLLSGTLLPSATILVTSRPSATVELWNKWKCRISRHIEVLGFSKDNIAKYISINVDDDERKNFERYLSFNPHIRSLMYVPINCTIVIAVYKDCLYYGKPHPKTVTELYTCLVESILRRYLKDHGFNDNIKSFASLPSSVHKNFFALTELAYEGVVTQKYIYSTRIEHLGLMDVVAEEHPFDCSYHLSYNFLHLSIQEYLAAYYVSLLPSHEQQQILQRMCNMKHLRNMCRYLAGITKFKDIDEAILKEVIENEFSKTLDDQEEPRRLEICGIIHYLLKAIERLVQQHLSGRGKEDVEMWKIAGDLLEATKRLFKQSNDWIKQKKEELKIAIEILNATERLVLMKRTNIDRWETANDLLNATDMLGKLINREIKEVSKEELGALIVVEQLQRRGLQSVAFFGDMINYSSNILKPHVENKILSTAMSELMSMIEQVLQLSNYALQLLYESEAIWLLEHCKTYKCTLSDFNSPTDLSILGYCVLHSNCTWILQFGTPQEFMRSTEGIEMLVQKLQRHRYDYQPCYRIKSLAFYHNNPDCIQQLLMVLPDQIYSRIEKFHLQYSTHQLPLPRCVPVLISRMKVLVHLMLEGATTDTLTDVLHSLAKSPNSTLQVFSLLRLNLNLTAMKALCSALHCHRTSMSYLSLCLCCINDEQASYLSKILGNLKLQRLILHYNYIHDREAIAIAEATHMVQTATLIHGNPISAKGYSQLAKYGNIHY